jgi:hypothetical protein
MTALMVICEGQQLESQLEQSEPVIPVYLFSRLGSSPDSALTNTSPERISRDMRLRGRESPA